VAKYRAFGGCVGAALWLLPVAVSAELSIDNMVSPAAWRDAIFDRFAVEQVEIGRLDLEIVASPGPSRGPFRASSLIAPLARLLDPELTPEIELAEVSIRRTGDPGGWDGEATFGQVSIADDASPVERTIVMEGALNEAPITVQASFAAAEPAPDGRLRRRFVITAALRGIDETIQGFLDADGSALEARVQIDVQALGDLLATLGLRRQLEGTGQLQLVVAGPVDDLAAEDISLVVELETGEQLRADGRIADLSRLSGIELGFAANLTDTAGVAPRASAALKLDLEALRGEVKGSAAALTLEGLVFSTNLTAADIQEIGPISVDRLVRDDEGRLALSGVRILAGDPQAPSLDLSGRIDDLLGRSGIAFEGRFDLDIIDLATDLPAPAGLGRLQGTLAFSDASGRLQLERLDARQVGGGPLGLTVEKLAVGSGELSSPITVNLDIPDLDALAAVQGAAPIGGGSAGFSGTIELAPDFKVFGRGHVGSSPVWLDLSEDVVDDQLVLRGGVKSPALRLGDLPRMSNLAKLWPRAEVEDTGATGDQLRARIDAELDTEATIVDAAGAACGDFVTKLTLRDGAAVLRPLRLDYLGGRADAELSVGIEQDQPPWRLEARIQSLDTGELLTELGARPLLVGNLDADLDLSATGPDRKALMASLDGEIEVLMGEGRIGSRLIDLTAQDIVAWLFSSGSGTRLACAAARLVFTAGRGRLDGLILKTENIQLLGAGAIDLRSETMDLDFEPRPMRGRLLPAVTSFRVQGPLTAPTVTVSSPGGVAGRAVVETLTLPFNVLGALLGSITAGRQGSECTLDP
jgi:AsmA family protein